jgi:hypothetical protein
MPRDEEFDGHLDSSYPQIEITGISWPASEVLFGMDEEAYETALKEYRSRQEQDFLDDIVPNNFPSPIAFYYYQTHHGYENNIQRLHLLRSTWEAVIYMLYAFVFSEIRHSHISISGQIVFGKKLSLDSNSILSDKLGYRIAVIDVLRCFCHIFSISDHAIAILKDLNSERNSFSHIAALNEKQAEERFGELSIIVNQLLLDLRWLEDISILRYQRSLSPASKVRFAKYVGHSLNPENSDKSLQAPDLADPFLRKENLYVDTHGVLICLSPFLHTIEEHGHCNLCFMKKQNGNKLLVEKIAPVASEAEIDLSILSDHLVQIQSLI